MGDVYSLLSAAVLATDIARHPYAVRLADTLDRALALDPAEQVALQHPARADVRLRVLATCAASPRVTTALGDAVAGLGTAEVAPRLMTLDEALLGALTDVHALLLREGPVASLPADAQQVVLDAVTAAWAGPQSALADLHELAGPFREALLPLPPTLPERPWTAAVRRLLDEVSTRPLTSWARSEAAHRHRRGLAWSDGMHQACQAARDTDQVLDVARAQLAAARALALAHTGISPYAAGMVVTAAVQATCVVDLLDRNVAATLLTDWEAGG